MTLLRTMLPRQRNWTVKAIPLMVHNLALLLHVPITGRLHKLMKYGACGTSTKRQESLLPHVDMA